MSAYRPAWWLPGPHTVTLWGKFGRKEPPHDVRWEQLPTPDGDFIELAHLENGASPDAPRMLILHGLEGGVNSHYVRGLMREAAEREWNATLMLFRTCGPTPNTLPRSYHSGETGDPWFVIEQLIQRAPSASLGLVGISLGGNVLCKMLGERDASLPHQLKAAVAMSTPFDLARGSKRISRGFSRIYEQAFLRSLVPKAQRKIARHTELTSVKLNKRIASVWQFDDEFTSQVHGFRDAADYYTRSSSLQYLSRIRLRTLLLSAVDDPFLPPEVLEDVRRATADNGAITLEFPERGGHVGFVGGSLFRPFYYGEWRASEFLAAAF